LIGAFVARKPGFSALLFSAKHNVDTIDIHIFLSVRYEASESGMSIKDEKVS